MHLGSQRSLSFLIWIAFSVFVHFGLTCALLHPIDKQPPTFSYEKAVYGAEAAFVPSIPLPPPPPPSSKTKAIVETVTEGPAAPPAEISNTPSIDRSFSEAPVFSLENEPQAAAQETNKPDDTHSALTASRAGTGAQGSTNPRAISNPIPRYPAQARSAGQEGTVRLEVQVTAEGKPYAVNILQSSGYTLLDERAYETILKKWRFSPAKENNKPVEGSLILAITFRLDD